MTSRLKPECISPNRKHHLLKKFWAVRTAGATSNIPTAPSPGRHLADMSTPPNRVAGFYFPPCRCLPGNCPAPAWPHDAHPSPDQTTRSRLPHLRRTRPQRRPSRRAQPAAALLRPPRAEPIYPPACLLPAGDIEAVAAVDDDPGPYLIGQIGRVKFDELPPLGKHQHRIRALASLRH